MVSAILTDNERDNMAVWVATLLSSARTQHGIVRLPVTRLQDAIRHLVESGRASDVLEAKGQDVSLPWLSQALNDAQDLGLELEGPAKENLNVPIEHAHKILKWIAHRNGTEYSIRVTQQAEAMATFLNHAS